MFPKFVTAIVSAALLAAILGMLPSEASGAEHAKGKVKEQPVAERTTGAADLNRPSTDFRSVTPQIDAPDRNHIAPKRDRNQFFNQKE